MKNLMSEFIARFLSIDSKKDNEASLRILIETDIRFVSGGSGPENGEQPRTEKAPGNG